MQSERGQRDPRPRRERKACSAVRGGRGSQAMRRESHEQDCKPGEAPEGRGGQQQPALQKRPLAEGGADREPAQGPFIQLRVTGREPGPSRCRRQKRSDSQAPRRKGVQPDQHGNCREGKATLREGRTDAESSDKRRSGRGAERTRGWPGEGRTEERKGGTGSQSPASVCAPDASRLQTRRLPWEQAGSTTRAGTGCGLR